MMTRRPKHQLTEAESYKGQISSRQRAGWKGRKRQEGMFIDAAGFILDWRLNDGKGYPSIAQLRAYLISRGWTGERGGELSRTEVTRMLAAQDPVGSAIPAHKAEWEAIKKGWIEASAGSEIVSIAIEPAAWLEMRQKIIDGWTPLWRERALTEENEESLRTRMNDLLSR